MAGDTITWNDVELLSGDFGDRHKADHRFTTFYDSGAFRRYLKSQLYVRSLRTMHHAPYQEQVR